jgi:hypothetical protein
MQVPALLAESETRMSEDAERIAVLHRTLAAALDIKKHNKLSAFVPYAKQQEFFELGATRRERMFNAGNQLGEIGRRGV